MYVYVYVYVYTYGLYVIIDIIVYIYISYFFCIGTGYMLLLTIIYICISGRRWREWSQSSASSQRNATSVGGPSSGVNKGKVGRLTRGPTGTQEDV